MGIIRLLLAMAVFNSHFEFSDLAVVDGHEAVLSFFAISGFYMALVLDTAYDTATGFYKSRFLALYPLYVLALGISAVLLFAADIHPMASRKEALSVFSDPMGFVLMAWTSLCLVGQELLFCIGQGADGGLHFVATTRQSIFNNAFLIQAWSLSLETVFYILAPLLVRLRSKTLASLCLASLALRVTIVSTPASELSFFLRFFPADFWLFGCGILAYRFFRGLSKDARPADYLAFVLLAAFVFTAGGVDKAYEPFFLPVCTLGALPFIFRGFRHLHLDRVVGKITYPFYLLHFSAIAVFEEYADEPGGWQILLATLAVAVITFALSNPVIEAMKIRFGSRLSPARKSVPGPCLGQGGERAAG